MEKQQNTAPYFLHQGTNYTAYEYLGAHREGDKYVFRVWSPSAREVRLVGDFCSWDKGLPMKRVSEGGVWQTSLSCHSVRIGDKYKYKICTADGEQLRADPYAQAYERFPADASVVCGQDSYRWRDGGWLECRKKKGFGSVNAYALDLGSYMRRENGEYPTYATLARELAPYVKQMGYTHILICDACEYTQYGEHYETYGYFAPTARHGSPRDFMAFVDCMHEAGVGVMICIDFTEFPQYALGKFDGSALYERKDNDKRIDLSRAEVECFLASAAHLWLEKYHIDGLALLGISEENCSSRGEYLRVASFFRKVNSYLKATHSGVMLVAQGLGLHSALADVSDGGLGFDTVIHSLTHGGLALSEDLPEGAMVSLSRRSLVASLVGEYDDKFAKARMLYGRMMCAPTHKLVYSGQEIGQFDDMTKWRQTQWFLLNYEAHAGMQRYVAELSSLWQRSDALRVGSYTALECAEAGVSAFVRRADNQEVLVLINGTSKNFESISQGVPTDGTYREIFNSDDIRYRGRGRLNSTPVRTHAAESGIYKSSADFKLPPLAITVFIRV